ncbi:MAG: helix-turn-helix transcriptional regulator, partial [Chitinophagaceae bacterium]
MGQLIKQRAKEKGLSLRAVGELINRSRQAVAHIYKRASIDSVLLKRFCEVLEVDFLAVYYEDGFLKIVREKERDRSEIGQLTKELAEQKEIVASFVSALTNNKPVVQLIEPAFKTYSMAIDANEQ